MKIGIDYGGVCSAHSDFYESKEYTEEVGVNIPDCVDVLKKLKELGHELILVSFCGAKRAKETNEYLNKLQLFDKMYFVKKRDYKDAICRYEGIDVMIDDRLDILQTIKNTDTLWFKYENHPSNLETKFEPQFYASNWLDVANIISAMKPKNLNKDNAINIVKLCYNV
jgi:hypothetical protein